MHTPNQAHLFTHLHLYRCSHTSIATRETSGECYFISTLSRQHSQLVTFSLCHFILLFGQYQCYFTSHIRPHIYSHFYFEPLENQPHSHSFSYIPASTISFACTTSFKIEENTTEQLSAQPAPDVPPSRLTPVTR